MRVPRPRFPFLIVPFQEKPPASPAVSPVTAPSFAENQLKQIVKAIEELKPPIEANGEKMSKVMGKIGLLESALDEFFESSRQEDDLAAFFEQFIPVLDNLQFIKRAVEESGDDQWKKGVAIFYEKLDKLFSDFGFESAAQKGMLFDPSRHEAVDTVMDPGLSPGTVADILLDGWIYNGRLLRYAKVIIVKEK